MYVKRRERWRGQSWREIGIQGGGGRETERGRDEYAGRGREKKWMDNQNGRERDIERDGERLE